MTPNRDLEADRFTSARPAVSDPRHIAMTIADIVADHAVRQGDAIAVQDIEASLTYAELAGLAAGWARRWVGGREAAGR